MLGAVAMVMFLSSTALEPAVVTTWQETRQDQSGSVDGVPTEVDSIEVLGRRGSVEEETQSFVSAVASAPAGTNLARWHGRICVGVANLVSPYAQLVADRISTVGGALGLEIGEPGCRANIMVIFADDATDVARKIVAEDPGAFIPSQSRATLGDSALSDFQNVERPVRWWHISMPVELDTGRPPVMKTVGDGVIEVPVLDVRQFSRLHSGVRNDLQRVVVIVDVTRLHGANLASVADYVSMVALAQVRPDVDVTAQLPSILGLFLSQSTSDRLTEWDIGYLQSLYEATGDRPIAEQQMREIGRTMARRARKD